MIPFAFTKIDTVPKDGKQLYCFYATPKGEKPTVKEKSWHNYIYHVNSLLNKVLTRSEKKLCSSFEQLATALQPKPISSKMRKLGRKTHHHPRCGKLLFYMPAPPPFIHLPFKIHHQCILIMNLMKCIGTHLKQGIFLGQLLKSLMHLRQKKNNKTVT